MVCYKFTEFSISSVFDNVNLVFGRILSHITSLPYLQAIDLQIFEIPLIGIKQRNFTHISTVVILQILKNS